MEKKRLSCDWDFCNSTQCFIETDCGFMIPTKILYNLKKVCINLILNIKYCPFCGKQVVTSQIIKNNYKKE